MARTTPPDITATSLTKAKKAQLEFWIKEANTEAGKKVLNKSGKTNEVLRHRLAAYHGIDLSPENVLRQAEAESKSERPAGPLDVNRTITKRQWAYLRELADEWREKAKRNEEFTLLHRSVNYSGE